MKNAPLRFYRVLELLNVSVAILQCVGPYLANALPELI